MCKSRPLAGLLAYTVCVFACARLSKIELLAGGSTPVAPVGMRAAMRGQSAEPLSTACPAERPLAISPNLTGATAVMTDVMSFG